MKKNLTLISILPILIFIILLIIDYKVLVLSLQKLLNIYIMILLIAWGIATYVWKKIYYISGLMFKFGLLIYLIIDMFFIT